MFDVLRERADFQQVMAALDKAAEAQQLASRAAGNTEQTLADRLRAADLLKGLVIEQPGAQRHRTTLAATLHSIGVIQTGLKKFSEAEQALLQALELRDALRQEQPGKPEPEIDWIGTRSALGNVYWSSARFPEGHRMWQQCSDDLLKLAEAQRENTALQERIAIEERFLCDSYGRYGLWPLAGEYVRRGAEFRRVSAHEQDAEFAALLLLPENASTADAYLTMLAAITRSAEERETWRITHLVRTAAFLRTSAVSSVELVSRARRALAIRNNNPWWATVLAMALYRAGQFQEAQELIRGLGEMGQHAFSHPQIYYVQSIMASALGDDAAARTHLTRGEALYRQACLESLAHPVVDSLGLPTENWHELIHVQALRREALRLIQGREPGDDPWQPLIQARGYRLIGEMEQADRELAAAATTGDPDIWMARARLLSQWDDQERSVAADWQKTVELASDDPSPWIQRGRWYAERGEQAKADADFANAASLTPNELNKFLEAGWWVVGPYPLAVKEFCPPEIDPDPSRPVYIVDPKTGLSEQPVAWRSAPAGELGRVDLRSVFQADSMSAYALTYVYATEERTATLLARADDVARVWLNGQLVHETTTPVDSTWVFDRVPVTLHAGRNTLLVKVSQVNGGHVLMLRLADSALDRAMALAELGLWASAVNVLPRPDADRLPHDIVSLRCACLRLAAGDMQGYRQECETMLGQFEQATSSGIACNLAWACTLAPDLVPDAERLVQAARKGLDPQPQERYRLGVLGRALYRAGRFDEAVTQLTEIADLLNPVNDVVLAMAWQQKGDAAQARAALARAQIWYDAATQQAVKGPIFRRPHWHWCELAVFQILYREARTLIDGTTTFDDQNASALAQRAREELKRQDPLTADFDRTLRSSPTSRVSGWPVDGAWLSSAAGPRPRPTSTRPSS